eukprot:g3449.t1
METEAIVIDNGTGTIKAGFAGEDHPRHVQPTVLEPAADGSPVAAFNRANTQGEAVGGTARGAAARAAQALAAEARRPIKRGVVDGDWDAMAAIWDNIFQNELHVDPEASAMPVLLTDAAPRRGGGFSESRSGSGGGGGPGGKDGMKESKADGGGGGSKGDGSGGGSKEGPPDGVSAQRGRAAQIMFEQFKVPGLFISTTPVLSLFAAGRTRGVVVESGEGVTSVVPIFEGVPLQHAQQRVDLAGTDLTTFLAERLASRGYAFAEGAAEDPVQRRLVQGIKERACAVALDYDEALRAGGGGGGGGGGGEAEAGVQTHELPDGTVVSIDAECRSGTAEVLFRPSLIGRGEDVKGLGELTAEVLSHLDEELLGDMYGSVVLAGGTSMVGGLKARMTAELRASAPEEAEVCVVTDSQRKYAAWIGGSMLASFPTFPKIQITRQEYEEEGADRMISQKGFC